MTAGALDLTYAGMPGYVGPAYSWRPPRLGTYGPDAVDVIGLAGHVPDADQRAAIDLMLSFGPGGRLLTLEQGMVEARQNGKTDGVILPVVVFDAWELCSVAPDRIVWTAHLYKTAQLSFESLCVVIESTPELSRDVKNIRYTNGEQSVTLNNGTQIDFVARSGGQSGRGLGGKRLVLDEALYLAPTIMGAVMPLLSARPNPQITYASSATKADAPSGHFRSIVRRGRRASYDLTQPDPSLIYIEYCAPGGWGTNPCPAEADGGTCQHGVTPGCTSPVCERGRDCTHLYGVPGCAFDNTDHWQSAGHTTGVRITHEYVHAESRSMRATPEGVLEFGRERMGWHEFPADGDSGGPVDMTQWDKLSDVAVQAPKDQGVAIGVDVPPDQSATFVAVAWWWAGRRWVMVHQLAGTATASTFVRNLQERGGVIDTGVYGAGPAGVLLKPFQAEYVDHRPISGPEMAQGVATWLAGVKDGTLGHLGQPELYAAQKGVQLRDVGDGVMWTRPRDSLVNLSPLYAATIAFSLLGQITEDDQGPNIW